MVADQPRARTTDTKTEKLMDAYTSKRNRSQVDCSKGGRTITSFADDLDIKNIVSRYLVTGEKPLSGNTPVWGQSMPEMEYSEMLEKVAATEQWFATLPAKTRGAFENDPARALEYLENEQNKDAALEQGLATENVAVADATETVTDSETTTEGTDTN